MKIKTLTILLFSALLTFLSGCSSLATDHSSSLLKTPNSADETIFSTIRLLYSSKDSLDPYSCVTEQNFVLSQLIFDPLLSLNNQYEVKYRLALSVNTHDKICTIKLRDAKFSDGTMVTADDVVFSFNKAKNSTTTRYSAALKYAETAKAQDTKTVIITLSRQDDNFANLLTFPIMKEGSDDLKDSDNRALSPIGAGRFVFNNEVAQLTQNKYYYGGSTIITTVQTVDCPDNESVEQAINAGMVDFFYTDLSDNVIPKMNGTSVDISQTKLVFLGVNPNSTSLSNSLIRQAISTAIDRNDICSLAYFSKATPALGPVPTAWKPATGYMTIQSTPNTKTAAENIELAGFANKDKNGYYLLLNGKPITLTMIVNSENEFRVTAAEKIVKSCALAGIKVILKSVNQSQYESLLRNGSYDLYLGEIRFEENMDIGGLMSLDTAQTFLPQKSNETSSNSSSSSSNLSYSSTSTSQTSHPVTSSSEVISSESSSENIINPGDITLTTADAYVGYYEGIYSLQDLITTFTAELPVIPICFKNGLVIYSDRFKNGITPSRSDLFHGI